MKLQKMTGVKYVQVIYPSKETFLRFAFLWTSTSSRSVKTQKENSTSLRCLIGRPECKQPVFLNVFLYHFRIVESLIHPVDWVSVFVFVVQSKYINSNFLLY